MDETPQQGCAPGHSSPTGGRLESQAHILKVSKFEDDGRRDQSIKSHKGKGQSEACGVPSGPTSPKQPQEHFPQQETTHDGNVVMTVKIANSIDIK